MRYSFTLTGICGNAGEEKGGPNPPEKRRLNLRKLETGSTLAHLSERRDEGGVSVPAGLDAGD